MPVYRREASEGTAPAGKKPAGHKPATSAPVDKKAEGRTSAEKKSAEQESVAKQPVDKKPATAKPAAEKSANLGKADKAVKPASSSAARKSAESDKVEKAGKAERAQKAQKVESPAEATKVNKAVGEPKVGKPAEKATVGKPAGESKASGGSEGDKPKRRDIYEVLGRARPQRIQAKPQPKEPLPKESQDEHGARDAAAGAAGVAAVDGTGARAGKDAGPADRTVKPIPAAGRGNGADPSFDPNTATAAQPGSASGNLAGAKSGADNGREELSFLKRNETKPVPVAGAAGAAGAAGVAGAATADRANAAQPAGKAGNDAHGVKADNGATPESAEMVKTDGAETLGTAETAETAETTTKEAQPKRGTLSFGLLLLRLVIGGLLLVRGLQTLFAFGGDPGLDVLQQQWSDYNGAQILAVVVPAAEVIAGGLLILGLLTPFAAALAAVVAGFMTLNEFNNYQGTLWPYGLSPYIQMWVLIGTGTMATIFAGPGSISLDRNRAWNTRPLVSAWIFAIVAVAATVVLWLAIGGGNPFN